MGTISKKIFSTVVTLSTVLSSVGVGAFAAPSVASAATLMNGDLIKASGPAVYYYAGDSKRYVFANETTYRTWFADFSTVKTISDAELAAIQIGGNVTIRPGTKLVKITTDPKVYAVTRGGVLHWVESEAVATALFGSDWAHRVVDVPDAFFVNYSVPTGGSISTAVHPDGALVSYAGSSDRFVVMGGQKRRITDAGFSANMFQAGNVIQTSVVYPNGADVTARESLLSDAVVTSGSTTPVGGSLTVSLASDTPAGMVIPNNANNVMFTKVNLTAGSAGVTVSGLRFHRVGVGIASDFTNVYLYDATGKRLTSGRTINSSSHMVEFNSLNLSIAAGQTVSLVLTGDLNGRATSFVTGGQHAFELADAASVMVSGAGTVSGSFPVRGNAMTVGTAQVARVDVQDGSEPADPRVGTADAEIANFKLVANGSNDVEVRRVTLYQGGSISNSDLSNLNLYQGSTLVAHADSVSNDGKIVLNFSTPFLVPNGQTRTFNLRGAVAGRSGRTIRIYTEYTTDVYAIDRVQNIGAEVCVSTATSPTCSGTYDGSGSTTSNASYSSTVGGQFTITYNGPATANVARSQNDVVFYKFSITSGSNDIEVRRLNFAATATTGVLTDGTTDNLRDIKVKDADTGETVAGPVSLGSSSVSFKSFSPSTSFTVRAGQTRNFVITADTASTITNGDGFVFALGALSGGAIFGSTDLRVLSSGEFLTTGISPNTTVTGNTMTVQASSLTYGLSGTPSSGVSVKNQANIPSVSFMLTAGAQSNVRVTSLKVTGAGKTTGGWDHAALASVVNSCGLFDAGVAIGNRMNPGATNGDMTFSSLNLDIARGTSKTIEVRCSADSVIQGASGDRFALGIAADADVSAQDTDGNTVTPSAVGTSVTANSTLSPVAVIQTVKANGTLTVATNNLRPSTILVAGGSTWQNMAEFKATAQYEDVTIDYVAVTSSGTDANFARVAVVQSDASGCASYTVKGDRDLPNGVDQMQEIDLSTSPIVVPKGSSTYVCLMGQLASVVPSATNSDVTAASRSGNAISLGLAASLSSAQQSASSVFNSGYSGKLAVRATGAASGERVYQTESASLSGNSFVVRKSKPVVTQQMTGLSTTLSAGQKTLYRAQIGSEGGDVAVKQLVFQVSVATTSNMTLGLFRIQKNGSDMLTSDVSIFDGATTSTDLSASSAVSFAAGSHTGTLNVVARFANEEVLSGTGNTYALVATVGGLNSTTGDSITTSLVQQSLSSTKTGYVAQQPTAVIATAMGDTGVTNNSNAPGVSGLIGAALLWSDMSETPHYSTLFTSLAPTNVSRDWTNEYLVNTISGSMVLSK
jgi:hypothetical protein